MEEYGFDIDKNISSLLQRLARESFSFKPSKGAPVLKKDKKTYRPIVISPVENKIVQRVILTVLSCSPKIKPYFDRKVSFGAIPESGVSDAIRAAMLAIRDGGAYYCRSDIKKFFDNIPKKVVGERFRKFIADDKLYNLFMSAIEVELDNMAALGDKREIFPIYEIGVTQGNCLSPLVANVVLGGFDDAMNRGHITCLRYVDDYLIIASKEGDCRQAFEKSVRKLDELELTAYNPYKGDDKAAAGKISSGFEFLGIAYSPGLLSPSKNARSRLKSKINECIEDSIDGIKDGATNKKPDLRRFSYARTIYQISNIISGWGGQYSFCNNKQVFQQIDEWVDQVLSEYSGRIKVLVRNRRESGDKHASRRISGIAVLEEKELDVDIERLSHQGRERKK